MNNNNKIIVNCTNCHAKLEVQTNIRSVYCKYCDNMFNIEDGIKFHEILMNRQFIKEEIINENIGKEPNAENPIPKKAKYCTDCGRKLALDAKFCDWCGIEIKY